MDFDVGKRLEIRKAIIVLTNSSRGSGLVQNKLRGGKRSKDSTMIFYKKDMQILLVITTGRFMW